MDHIPLTTKFKMRHKKTRDEYWFDLMWGSKACGGGGWIGAVPFGEKRSHRNFGHSDNRVLVDPNDCIVWIVRQDGRLIMLEDEESDNGTTQDIQ